MLFVGREGKTSENDMSTRIIGGVSYPMDLWQNEAAQQFIPAVMVTHSQLATIGAPAESDTYLVDETGLPYKWSTTALAWVALFPNSLVPGPAGNNGTNGTNGVSPVMSIGTVSSGSPAACTMTGTPAAPILNLTVPPGTAGTNGTNGTNGANNVLSIGTVTQGPVAATISGTSPNQTLSLVLPKGDTGANGTNGTNGTNGVGISPSTPVPMTVVIGTAYQAPDPTKAAHINLMLESNYVTTLAGTSADELEVRIGPTNAVTGASGGTQAATWKTSLTGITLTIGLGLIQRNPVPIMLPIGWYFCVRRLSGTAAIISSAVAQPLG